VSAPPKAAPTRVLVWALLLLVLAELAVVGVVGLPSVHGFYDPVGIRDAGTSWTALTWDLADRRHFLPAAVLGHIEGPLQFIFLNAYYHAIGDLLPLDPLTAQVPNTVAAGLATLLCYALGRRAFGERVGLFAGLAFGLLPWLAVTIRLPWVFVTFSTALELATLYAYLRLMEGEDRRWKALAPAALAAYLTTGLDWPSFGPVLVLFLFRAGALGSALRNRWNLLPAAVMAVYVAWTVAMWGYGYLVNPAHAHLYRETLLLYPFFKVAGPTPLPSWAQVARFVVDSFGLMWPVAVAGALCVFAGRAGGSAERRQRIASALAAAMAVWLVVFSVPLLRLPSSVTYAYVVAVPTALLAGLVLARVRPVYAAVVLFLMVGFQLQPLVGSRVVLGGDDDRRVPAAATYLIERRPDLLGAGKVAFVPGDASCNVAQYARGKNARVMMPLDFPATMRSTSVASPEPVLADFVRAYRERGEIRADWLVLSTEALAASPAPAAAFYGRLLADPSVSWVACFVDGRRRGLWLGEVGARRGPGPSMPGGVSAAMAPCHDVTSLAEVYTRRYDRIGFLKRDVRHVLHY